MKSILYLFFAFFSIAAFSQISCDYMFDSYKLEDGVIMSAKRFEGSYLAVITKLDMNGQEVWRIEDDIDGHSELNFIELFEFSDGFLYAMLRIPDSHHNSPPNSKILKIDAINGSIIWETGLYPFDENSPSQLIEYDPERLIFQTSKRDNNGGTIAGFEVRMIDRMSGSIDLIHESNRALKSITMAKDSKGNMYHTFLRRDNPESPYITSIRKVNGVNFKNVIWEKDYIRQFGTPSLEKITHLYVNNLDEIFAFRSKENVDLFKINSINGSEIWSKRVINERVITDIQFIQNKMYLSLRHLYIGGYSNFSIIKFDLETATTDWITDDLHMTVVGTPLPYQGDQEGINSFDIDCQGDIYASGYYRSNGAGPGAWGIMKISGQDGTKINERTISSDLEFVDKRSNGLKSFIINDTPVFLGNLETESNNSAFAFLTTSTDLTSVEIFQSACGTLADDSPIANCSNFVGVLNAQGEFTLSPSDIDNGSYGFNEEITLTVDQIEFNCDDLGEMEVTLIVTDGIGQVSTCTAIVTIVDNEAPVIDNCPSSFMETVPEGGLYTIPDFVTTLGLTIADNCSATFIGQSPEIGTTVGPGHTGIAITGADPSGNEVVCYIEFWVEEILGTEVNNLKNNLTIYPNPTSGKLMLSNSSDIPLISAEIRDTNGRIIHILDLSDKGPTTEISLEGLAAGMYFIKVKSENAFYSQKIIKE